MRSSTVRWATLTVVVASLGLLGVTTLSPAGAAQSGTPKRGGTIVLARQSEPKLYDAAKMTQANQPAQAIYDQLFYLNDKQELTPGLPLSLETDPTNTTYTIKLRKGVTFSDGTPFDAAAVMAHWTRMQDPATASPGRADAAEIASMQAPDTSTVKVTLAAPDATWRIPLATANLSWIPSPTAVAKFGATFGTTPESTVGAGPFLLKELVFSDHQTYVRNPNYWDKPKPYLDSMTFKTFFDPQTRYNTFVSGGADAIENISAAQTNVDLDKSYASISTPPLGGGYGFAFNMKTGPTADVDVRQAMMYAVDMKAVLTRAAPGQLFAPSLFDRDAPWFANIPLPYDNLKKAQQHLDAYLQRTGQQSTTVDIVMPTDFATIMDALKQEWAKLKGLNVNVAIETAVQTASRIARRDYPGGLVQSIAGTPRAALNQFLSGAPANTAFLSDPAMDAAVKKANETTNPAQVKAAMNTVAERYNALLPYMMIARLNSSVWVKPYVKDAKTDPVAVTLWRSQDMWRSKP